jgi:hypothetical protein
MNPATDLCTTVVLSGARATPGPFALRRRLRAAFFAPSCGLKGHLAGRIPSRSGNVCGNLTIA